MVYILVGVIVFIVIHLMPRLARGFRQSVINCIGDGKYKAIYSLITLTSIGLIVYGWNWATPINGYLYTPLVELKWLSFLLMYFAFILFGSARAQTNIKQIIKHPQLISVIVWGIAHLLMNSSYQSVILFGGLGIWALIQMILINIQTDTYFKPNKVSITKDIKLIVIASAIFTIVLFIHFIIL